MDHRLIHHQHHGNNHRLANGTAYDFRVTARNSAGAGTSSSTVTATTTTPPATLLDNVATTAARAYSVRKLRAAYAGAAIRVRRSSDSTEQDIGFVSGNLDTAALLSFAGSGDAFVKTWYDQSGNGLDLTQATAASQPKIVSAGATITESSKPWMAFDGAASYFTGATPGMYAAGASTILTLAKGNGRFRRGSSANPERTPTRPIHP